MMRKIIVFGVLFGVIGLIVFGLTQIKPFAIKQIKKQIIMATEAKTVKVKDLQFSWQGPLVLSGLEINKGNDFNINVTHITLDRGLWGLFQGSHGSMRIKSLMVNQIKIKEIKIGFWLKGEDLKIDIDEGAILNGTMNGHAVLRLTRVPSYQATMVFENLSMPQFVKDFKLKDKVQITGLMGGKIEIQGMGKDFQIIDGKLDSLGAGGELVITDTQYLESMARRSGQSFDLIVASLKHYLYNNGRVQLALNQGNLDFDIALEGAAGKRKLTIVLHDFNLERFGL